MFLDCVSGGNDGGSYSLETARQKTGFVILGMLSSALEAPWKKTYGSDLFTAESLVPRTVFAIHRNSFD